MVKFTPVQSVMNVYDQSVLWYGIEGYRGYEVSTTHLIRSMKHFNKYPFGILIKPKKDRDGNIIHPEDPIYELSDNNNERQTLSLSQILYIVNNTPDQPGYPRYTIVTNQASRTQRAFTRKSPKHSLDNNEIIYPQFTVIKEESMITGIFNPVKSTGE